MTSKSNIVSVIGAGSWGTAIAKLVSENVEKVYLISKDKDLVKIINTKMCNTRSLPDICLPNNLMATSFMDVCQESDAIFIASDFSQIGNIAQKLAVLNLKENVQFVLLCKGIEQNNLKLSSQILESHVKNKDIFTLSGPNYAKEVAKCLPTISTLAGPIEKNENLKDILQTKYFSLECHADLIGAQLCGALKNVLAIGCGIIDGYNNSYNNKAMLFHLGILEIKEIIRCFGADENIINLSCGIGDLYLTCSNSNSRNYAYGKNLADKNGNNINNLVEGLNSVRVIADIKAKYKLTLPVLSSIYEITMNQANIDSLTKITA